MINTPMNEIYFFKFLNGRKLYSIPKLTRFIFNTPITPRTSLPKTRFIFNASINQIPIQYPIIIFYIPINGIERDLYMYLNLTMDENYFQYPNEFDIQYFNELDL